MAVSPILLFADLKDVFLSAYRPILMQAYCPDNDIAYIRGELFIDSDYQSGNPGTWVSTGVMMNSFTKTVNGVATPGFYEFNLMEYVRHYVGQANSPIFSWSTYVAKGRLETNRFRLELWPVRYSPNAQGQTFDALEDLVATQDFIATPANLDIDVSTNTWGGTPDLDRYVLGSNRISGAAVTKTTLPLTVMPHSSNNDYLAGQHIHMWDQQGDSLYTYYNLDTTYTNLYLAIIRYNDGVNMTGFDFIDVGSKITEKFRLPVHPKSLDMFLTFASGAAYNKIVNSSGNLICKRVRLLMGVGTGMGNLPVFWSTMHPENAVKEATWYNIHYSDAKFGGTGRHNINQGKCERTKFVFQNRLGGYDWFSSYGTHKQGVTMSGTKYERAQQGTASNSIHHSTWLKTNREDNYTVISQPVPKETALWLADLATSAKVWVQTEYKHSEIINPMGTQMLLPILINPNTFELITSDESVYFVQFDYTLSRAKTSPLG